MCSRIAPAYCVLYCVIIQEGNFVTFELYFRKGTYRKGKDRKGADCKVGLALTFAGKKRITTNGQTGGERRACTRI